MTVLSIGDAHCIETFRGIPGCLSHHVGQVTMTQVARDGGVPGRGGWRAATRGLGEGDVVVACFGELDVRGGDVPEEVSGLTTAYMSALQSSLFAGLPPGVVRAVMLPPPPSRSSRCAPEAMHPMRGTDEERSSRHVVLTTALRVACRFSDLIVFDPALFAYTDDDGLLKPALSNGSHYIGYRAPVRQELELLMWVRPECAQSSSA